MIELAPHHKIGLSLSKRVMIASGFAGYGEVYRGALDLSQFGAIVTNPVTLRPERGQRMPRVAETSGGLILDSGGQNPGVKRVIERYQAVWAKLQIPVIIHLPPMDTDDLIRTARALSGLTTAQNEPLIAGFEIGLLLEDEADDVTFLLRQLQTVTPLPLLLKLPFGVAPEVISQIDPTMAACMVISSPPLATAHTRHGDMVTGPLYGAGLHSLIMQELVALRELTELPLIASGGLHTTADVEAFLTAGARAVQLDTLLFIDPHGAAALGGETRGSKL